MRHLHAVFGILLLLVVSLTYAGFIQDGNQQLESYMKTHGLEIETTDSYNLESTSEDKLAGLKVHRITARSDRAKIKAELLVNISGEYAERYLRNKNSELASMFTSRTAPYSGLPSQDSICEQDFVPDTSVEERQGYNVTVYEMFADVNYRYTCPQNAEYRAVTVTAYCPEEKTIATVTEFKPIEKDSSNVVESLRCASKK